MALKRSRLHVVWKRPPGHMGTGIPVLEYGTQSPHDPWARGPGPMSGPELETAPPPNIAPVRLLPESQRAESRRERLLLTLSEVGL